MSAATSMSSGADASTALAPVAGPVSALLVDFLADRLAELRHVDPALEAVGTEVAELVAAGGKRLRPAFVYWGHRASGADHDEGIWHAAGGVELLHTFALIHDDVMDRSPERRGRPAVHTGLAAAHLAEGLSGDPDWFGVGGAILAGDLAFVWADQIFDAAPIDPVALDRGRRVFTALRVEVMSGQYLDLRLAATPAATPDEALRVALLKSGRYTVSRPLQVGAAIADAPPEVIRALATYGDATGTAFQLRDDLLGVFGDPDATGKDTLGDLREGKRTMLLTTALRDAPPRVAEELNRLVGDPSLGADGAERAREIIDSTGAREAVEAVVASHRDRGLAALEAIDEPARSALVELAHLSTDRAT